MGRGLKQDTKLTEEQSWGQAAQEQDGEALGIFSKQLAPLGVRSNNESQNDPGGAGKLRGGRGEQGAVDSKGPAFPEVSGPAAGSRGCERSQRVHTSSWAGTPPRPSFLS